MEFIGGGEMVDMWRAKMRVSLWYKNEDDEEEKKLFTFSKFIHL